MQKKGISDSKINTEIDKKKQKIKNKINQKVVEGKIYRRKMRVKSENEK